uniref:Ovule protein n=1 Tax=Mesocestoides corti TaxID=53468 RepID=A0A5K3FM32_MESCO
ILSPVTDLLQTSLKKQTPTRQYKTAFQVDRLALACVTSLPQWKKKTKRVLQSGHLPDYCRCIPTPRA